MSHCLIDYKLYGYVMKLYHISKYQQAKTIQSEGFVDPVGAYGVIAEEALWRPYALKGVFFYEHPKGYNAFSSGEQMAVFVVDFPGDLIGRFEVLEEEDEVREGYREWCIPADIANQYFIDRTIYSLEDFLG